MRLVERVGDIAQRKFPVTVDIGCGAGHLAKRFSDREGIETLIQFDMTETALERTRAAESQGPPRPFKSTYALLENERLPLAPGSADLIVSNLCLHWVNDLPGLLSQILKALKPDGVFLASLLGGRTLEELRSALSVANMERRGGVAAHISPFANVSDCGNLLSGAGFALPTVDSDLVRIPYPDAWTLMEHLQGMGENNANLIRPTAVSHASQQRPLKRGTAQHSLTEISVGAPAPARDTGKT